MNNKNSITKIACRCELQFALGLVYCPRSCVLEMCQHVFVICKKYYTKK